MERATSCSCEQAAKDLEAANVNSKQCYADCGNVQKCTAEFEQVGNRQRAYVCMCATQ